MELKKKVTQKGSIIGVQVEDGDISYYVVIEALKTAQMIESLAQSGWGIVQLPADFRKNGLRIEDLPNIEYSAIPEAERYDFYSFDGEILPDSELVKHMPVKERQTIPWRAPIYSIIKTRDQLLEFLKKKEWRRFDKINPQSYLPLNAFVNPEALFTPEEYASRDNKEYTRLIEERRRMSYPAFHELVELLCSMGMPRGYNCIEFQRHYFSWGICGIRDERLSQQTEESLSRLGQLRIGNDQEGFTVSKPVLITSSGTTIPPMEPGWKMREGGIDYRNLEPDEVARVAIYQDSVDYIESITCSSMRAKINSHSIHLYIDSVGAVIKMSAAIPNYPFSYRNLPSDLFNIYDATVLEELTNLSFAESLTTKFINSLIERSDASTLKALRAVGMTENAALNFIAARMAKATPTDTGEGGIDTEESGRMKVIMAGITSYLSGNDDMAEFADDIRAGKLDTISADADYISEIADFCQDCKDGSINLDQTQIGASLDAQNNRSRVCELFFLALKYLGCTREQLFEQVSNANVSGEAEYINIFGEAGSYVKVPAIRGSLKINGYEKDLDGYMIEAAREAMLWINVKTVYTESGAAGPLRHVAIEYQVINHCNRSRNGMTIKHGAVETYFTEIVEDEIRKLPTHEKRTSAKMKMDAYVCRLIFSAYNSPSNIIRLPESLGGAIKEVSAEICAYLRTGRVVMTRYESLFGICDVMTENGEFNFFCNNARLSPTLVIPYKGEKIQERPFLPNWVDTSRDANRRALWAQAGIIPDSEFCGIFRLYPSMHGIDHVDENKKQMEFGRGNISYESDCYHKAPYSLLKYYDMCMAFRKNAIEAGNWKLTGLPLLEEVAYPRSFEERDVMLCDPSEFVDTFIHSKPRTLTKEIVAEEFPDLVNMAKVEYYNTQEDMAVTNEFRDISEIPAETLKSASSKFLTELCLNLADLIPLHFRFGDLCVFKDGFKFMFNDIREQDLTNYAVELVGGVYYFLNASGTLSVRCSDYGVVNG